MLRYFAKRFFYSFIVLSLVTIIVFVMVRLIPGPIGSVMAENVDLTNQSMEEKVEVTPRLDEPLPFQVFQWMCNLIKGDWGNSLQTGESVNRMFWYRLPVTAELFIGATFWSWIIGFPLGVIGALKRNSIFDFSFTSLGILGVSIPPFWEGIVFIYLFAVLLNILPPSGYVPFFEDPWLNIKSIFMPTLVMGTHSAGLLARYVRSSFLEVLPQDYIRTARAKGLSERLVIQRHLAKPAMIPVVTVIGLVWGHFAAGSFLVEYIFAIPGLGRMGVDAIFARDFPVIQVVLMVVAVNVFVGNLMADILYGFVDPRVRLY